MLRDHGGHGHGLQILSDLVQSRTTLNGEVQTIDSTIYQVCTLQPQGIIFPQYGGKHIIPWGGKTRHNELIYHLLLLVLPVVQI